MEKTKPKTKVKPDQDGKATGPKSHHGLRLLREKDVEQVPLAKVSLVGTVRRCGVTSTSVMVTRLTGATKTLTAPEANPILTTPYGVIRVIDPAT